MKIIYRAIPTNIITGFLGVGKTTAILSLLRTKPENESWAILVNEFGEVGIDGSLIGGTLTQESKVFIKEVPGGCLCCAAGVPMQIALNQLIKHAKPDRLLIEPTGLGHPQEIIASLSQAQYQEVIDLRATLTLVDARKIQDSRYTQHTIFNQQLEVADVIVAHKSDQYVADEWQQLQSYLLKLNLATTPLYHAYQGNLKPAWLDIPKKSLFALGQRTVHLEAVHEHREVEAEEHLMMPPCGYLHRSNIGEGFVSQGWLFEARLKFDYVQVQRLLEKTVVTRLKAVLITNKGTFAFNKVDESLTCLALETANESRIELIDVEQTAWAGLEEALLNCLI